MKMLWRLSREAIRYKTLYIVAILSTLGLTAVNLAAPKALSAMTGIVERGVDDAGLKQIGALTALLAEIDPARYTEIAAETERRRGKAERRKKETEALKRNERTGKRRTNG